MHGRHGAAPAETTDAHEQPTQGRQQTGTMSTAFPLEPTHQPHNGEPVRQTTAAGPSEHVHGHDHGKLTSLHRHGHPVTKAQLVNATANGTHTGAANSTGTGIVINYSWPINGTQAINSGSTTEITAWTGAAIVVLVLAVLV